MYTLADALNLLGSQIGANLDPVQRLRRVFSKYLDECDPVGSFELVAITTTTDANGQSFITLPPRYSAIRGAVSTNIANSFCQYPLELRNKWYEYAPGNLGMLVGSDPMRGIIPVLNAQGGTTTQYKVPGCITVGSLTYFTCICKISSSTLFVNDTDIIPVQSIEALSKGLKALDKFDAEDFVNEDKLWAKGKAILAAQTDNETGSEALGKVQVDDDHYLGCLGFEGDGGWGWGGWGWGWGDGGW